MFLFSQKKVNCSSKQISKLFPIVTEEIFMNDILSCLAPWEIGGLHILEVVAKQSVLKAMFSLAYHKHQMSNVAF